MVVCGVPIGNPRDASPRLGEVLATADLVAAEDTMPAADIVLIAIVGTAGLQPALAAIRAAHRFQAMAAAFAALEATAKPTVSIPLWDGHTAERILAAL